MRSLLRTLFIVAVVTLCSFFGITALAHPGRTDASGGHRVSATGEYHYHHGYSAHEHYDIDNDGDIDCPYDFKDNTDRSSSVSTIQLPESTVKYSAPSNNTTNYKQVTSNQSSSESETDTSLLFLVGIAFTSFLAIWFCYKCDRLERQTKNKDQNRICLTPVVQTLEREKDELRFQIDKLKSDNNTLRIINSELDASNQELTSDMRDLLGLFESKLPVYEKMEVLQRYGIYGISDIEIPDDVYFINGLTPVCGEITTHRPYGSYTVYVAKGSSVYHTSYNCGNGLYTAKHRFDLKNKRPCKICAVNDVELVAPPEWYDKLKKIRSKNRRRRSP